jgi:hypothetical protein
MYGERRIMGDKGERKEFREHAGENEVKKRQNETDKCRKGKERSGNSSKI